MNPQTETEMSWYMLMKEIILVQGEKEEREDRGDKVIE